MKATVVLQGVVVLLVVGIQLTQGQAPVVTTKYGKVRGKIDQRGATKINVFLGIPYAAPPIGARRFQKPHPPTSWTDIRNVTSFGHSCPQRGQITAHEDCLYINVWSPQVTTPTLPVLIYIHGGAYVIGSGQSDPFQLAKKDVVAVTLNYRLGALGYLSTQDAECPGNNGMLDQVFALQWVRDNIGAFGGNASRVTIFGESAGASSVSLHLLSPLSRGLFHGAMMESGVSLTPWATGKIHDHPTPRYRAFYAGTHLGCARNTSADLLACLRKLDAQHFLNASAPIPTDDEPWYPIVETINNFLPDSPLNLLKAGKVAPVPTVRGSNDGEYSQVLANADPSIKNGVTLQHLLNYIHSIVTSHYSGNINITKIEDAIKAVYAASANTTNNSTIRTSYIRILSDYRYTAPVARETQLWSQIAHHSPLYLYLFSYRSHHDGIPLWMGVPHAWELRYVFGRDLNGGNQTKSDIDFTNTVVTLWTNFAKYGNPTPQPVSGITWHQYTSEHRNYLSLGNQIVSESNLRADEMKLWNEIIPKLAGDR